jgi:competence protein ComEC
VPPLLTLLIGLIGRFPRPDIGVIAAASVVGVGWSTVAQNAPAAPALVPGTDVILEGWVEVELAGGALLHLDGGPVPIRPISTEFAGRPVRVAGIVARPWHPRGRPSVTVDSVVPWRAAGVEAPGAPPLERAWMRLRLGLRDRARARIESEFPRHAGLVAALVLADRSALAPDLRDRFARAGTAHLLAISGFHVGVLAGWVYLMLGIVRVPRRGRPPLAGALVWVYVATLGFPTSAVRAAVLVSAVCAGRLRGRPTHPLGAWGVALALVSLADPTALRGPGAQLSFAGSLGLLLWARSWGRRLGGPPLRPGAPRRDRIRRALGVAVAATVAAQVATVGFVAWHFQTIPLAGLPASVAATPAIAVALPGILFTLLATPVPIVAATASSGVEGLLTLTVGVVEVLGGAAGVAYVGPILLAGPAIGGVAGAVLATRGATARRRTGQSHRERAARRSGARVRGCLIGAWVGAALLPAASAVVPAPVEIHVLDVGQGDAIAIRSPRGTWTLVDAGPGRDDALARGLARLGVRRVETLVVTHPDLDHVGGAARVVADLRVGRIVGPGLLRGTDAVEALVAAASKHRVAWNVVSAGSVWESDGVRFDVIHAGGSSSTPNDHSVVLHVAWGEFDALLTGDVSSEIEDQLPGRFGPGTRVEILKVAHHGSRTSSSGAFLDRLAPAAAVVSVGRGNRFGHPAPDVLARYTARGIPIARTDRRGSIRIRGRHDGSFRIVGEFDDPPLARR